MLKKKTPDSIAINLKLKAQGEEFVLPVTYHNLDQKGYDALVDAAKAQYPDEPSKTNPLIVAGLVKNWDAEYDLTVEGLIEAENDRPYLLMALISGFFEARGVERVKN